MGELEEEKGKDETERKKEDTGKEDKVKREKRRV